MRFLRGALLLAALVLALSPEFPRYAAERRVGFATAAFRTLLERSSDPETRTNLLAVGEMALRETPRLPGDPRPWILGGSARLVTGQPQPALDYYREALATGERAEIDLNLGRAYAMLKRNASADAALLRAGWISPEILASLSPAVKDPLLAEIARLSAELAAGRLAAPPPLPEEERR